MKRILIALFNGSLAVMLQQPGAQALATELTPPEPHEPVASAGLSHPQIGTSIPAHENIHIEPPAGYVLAAQNSDAKDIAVQWVPRWQTVNNWSDRVQVNIYKGIKPKSENLASQAFVRKLQANLQLSCKSAISSRPTQRAVNGYLALLWQSTCPSVDQAVRPVVTQAFVVLGLGNLYIVRVDTRRRASDNWNTESMQYLGSVQVCEPQNPSHPCLW